MYLRESVDQAKKVLSTLGVTNTSGFDKLKDILSPNFGYLPLFTKFHYRDKIAISRIEQIYELIKQYSQLLKSTKINPLEYDNFEKLDDAINKSIIRNENLKFAKSFISNKYAYLLSEEGISLFGELKRLESSHKKVQDYMMRKIAAFKSPEEFNSSLSSLVNSLSGGWDPESVISRAEVAGGILVFTNGPIVLAKIPNYKVSKELGSSSWCISRSESYFKSYTIGRGVQYFAWNTDLPQSDKLSLIGITVDMHGQISACHNKSDGWLDVNSKALSPFRKHLKGPTKEDILNVIKNGMRVTIPDLENFKISKKEVLDIDPNYFKTSSELLKDIKSGIDLKESDIKRLSSDGYLKYMKELIKDNKSDQFWKMFKKRPSRSEEILNDIIDTGQSQKIIDYLKPTPFILLTLSKSDKFDPRSVKLPKMSNDIVIYLEQITTYEKKTKVRALRWSGVMGESVKKERVNRREKEIKDILNNLQILSDLNPSLRILVDEDTSRADSLSRKYCFEYEFLKYSLIKSRDNDEFVDSVIRSMDISDLLSYVSDKSLHKSHYYSLFRMDPITFQDLLSKSYRYDTIFELVTTEVYENLSEENKKLFIKTTSHRMGRLRCGLEKNFRDIISKYPEDFIGKIPNQSIFLEISTGIENSKSKSSLKYLFDILDKSKVANKSIFKYVSLPTKEKIMGFEEYKELTKKKK